MTAILEPARPSPTDEGNSAPPLRHARDRLIEDNRHIVDKLAEKFAWRMRHRVPAEPDDWKQEARKSLVRTIDLSKPGETQKSLEIRIHRNAKSRLIEVARPFRSVRRPLVPPPPARSLAPRADSQYYVEEIGEVQLLMFVQCCKHFPRDATRRLMPDLVPENRERLLYLARTNMSSNWLNDLGKMCLKQHHIEPLLLVHGLDLDQCEVARVLRKSSPAICMLLAYAEKTILAAGDKNIFKTSLINGA